MSFTNRVMPYHFTLYVHEEDEEMVKKYVGLCKRQGSSASQRIVEFIRNEISCAKLDLKPEVKCEFCGDQKATKFVQYRSGKKLWSCENCFLIRKNKDLVRVVLQEVSPEMVAFVEEEHFNPNLYGAK